jgi:hypothetical protein
MSEERSIFWQPWQGQGMEHLRLSFLEDHIVARGDVMAIAGSSPFRLRYKTKCDPRWHTRKLDLEVHDRHGFRERHIKADGQGNGMTQSKARSPSSPAASTSISRRRLSPIPWRYAASISSKARARRSPSPM